MFGSVQGMIWESASEDFASRVASSWGVCFLGGQISNPKGRSCGKSRHRSNATFAFNVLLVFWASGVRWETVCE